MTRDELLKKYKPVIEYAETTADFDWNKNRTYELTSVYLKDGYTSVDGNHFYASTVKELVSKLRTIKEID